MFNLFHKKSNKNSNEIINTKKEIMSDFILSLESFQNTLNSNLHWKTKEKILKIEIDLTRENYIRQINDLNLKGE